MQNLTLAACLCFALKLIVCYLFIDDIAVDVKGGGAIEIKAEHGDLVIGKSA